MSQAPPPALPMEGWIDKHADWLGKWHRRYARLTGPLLSYRLTLQDPEKGSCHVTAIQLEKGGTQVRVLTELGTTWLLRGCTPAEHTAWVAALRSVCSASMTTPAADAAEDAHQRESTALSAAPTCRLQGEVKKKSDWLGQWNSRFVVIDDLRFRYSAKQHGELRGTFTIAAADGDAADPTLLRLATTKGDKVEIRLATPEGAHEWLRVLRKTLSRIVSLRWEAVTFESSDFSDALLRASNHTACVMPQSSPPLNSNSTTTSCGRLVFGGSTQSHPTTAEAPPQHKSLLCEHLVFVELQGAVSRCAKWAPAPFEESPGAFVRPHGREGAAAAALRGSVFLHGGATKSSVLNELWELNCDNEPSWIRVAIPDLPFRVGHGLTTHCDRLVLSGGIDGQGKVETSVWSIDPKAGEVAQLPSFPEPRCRHAVLTPSDGSLVVLGGCTELALASGAAQAYRLEAGASAWSACTSEWSTDRTASLAFIAVAAWRTDTWVVLAGDCATVPKLYRVTYATSGKAAMLRFHPLDCSGDGPTMNYGLTLHVVDDFAYVIGDGAKLPLSPAVRRVLLPSA